VVLARLAVERLAVVRLAPVGLAVDRLVGDALVADVRWLASSSGMLAPMNGTAAMINATGVLSKPSTPAAPAPAMTRRPVREGSFTDGRDSCTGILRMP
jgi:hypothetical protein